MTTVDYNALIDSGISRYPQIAKSPWLDNWEFSAASFETTFGIKGISHTYTMPENQNPVAVLEAIEKKAERLNVALLIAEQEFEIKGKPVPIELQSIIQQEERKIRPAVLHTYRQMTNDNPELARLPANTSDTNQLLKIIWGAASGINPTDIQFYAIEGNTRDLLLASNDLWRRQDEEIRQFTRTKPDWLPAPSTQQLILKQLREQAQQKTAGTMSM